MEHSKIIGTGSYLPNEKITNDHLCELFGIDEWLIEELGIENRYWSVDLESLNLQETGAEMAANASIRAIENAGLNNNDIDRIVLVTAVPDYIMPNSVVLVQELLNIQNCTAIEIHAACAGAIQALEDADNAIKSGRASNVLVCCFNLMSPTSVREIKEGSINNLTTIDMLNASMFGDGASAVILTKSKEKGILSITNRSVGVGREPGMTLQAGGAVLPLSKNLLNDTKHKWKQNPSEILNEGGKLTVLALEELLSNLKMNYFDIDHFILPQANPSILKKDIEKLKKNNSFPIERIFYNVNRIGNTSTAAFFIALDELNRNNKIKRNEIIGIMGGEASKWLYGGTLIKWI